MSESHSRPRIAPAALNMRSPPNPFYDPNWPALAQAAQQALAAARAAEAQAPLGSPAHHLALAALEEARQATERAQRAAFPRIADYAAWRFSDLPEAKDLSLIHI